MSSHSKVTRRDVLKQALLLGGAACAGALASRNAHAQKVSKAAMKYQDKPNGDQKCSNCMQFEPPGSCKVVEGAVSPDGYCIAWVKKA
jgi:anaerobic selenocysteine-containing dehydrogenase